MNEVKGTFVNSKKRKIVKEENSVEYCSRRERKERERKEREREDRDLEIGDREEGKREGLHPRIEFPAGPSIQTTYSISKLTANLYPRDL